MAVALKDLYQNFANEAEAYLHIKDEDHYHDVLAIIENLLEEVEDTDDAPLNGLIDLLSQAVKRYEDSIDSLLTFEQDAKGVAADVAMLRLLMDQHGLTGAGFPEIGDKTLISRILAGQRNLTKSHIEKLAKRFGINPALFFDVA